jgi:hypothetical protein
VIIGDSPASRDDQDSMTDPTGLKALTFAYMDINTREFEQLK